MTHAIGCEEAIEQLWRFLDEELASADERALEAHLAFCRRCCGELEFARQLRRMLVERSSVEVPAEVRGRLERFVDELGGPAPPVGPGSEPRSRGGSGA